MPLEFFEDLPREDIESLWNQEVCMDDWDYLLVCPVEEFEEHEVDCEIYIYDGASGYMEDSKKTVYNPKSWNLSRLLTGCCSNDWYKAKFRGKEVMIGVAYHA